MARRLFHHLLAVALLGLCAAGCTVTGRLVTTTPAPIPATESAAPALATVPAATLPSPTAEPTATTRPTRPRPTSTPRPTVDPSTPTPEPDYAATLTARSTPRLLATYESPDGALRAEVLIYDCAQLTPEQAYAYDVLQIVEVAGGEVHVIDDQLQNCGGLGGFGLGGLFWSPSGRYFYYTDAREGVSDGCGFGYDPLSRADTTGWSAVDLGGGPLSPDGSRLASWGADELVVYEIDGGEVGRAPVAAPELYQGPIAWSPDGRALAYVQAEAFCVPGQSGRSVVAHVALPEIETVVLVDSSSPSFWGVEWATSDALRLIDDQGTVWRYDLATGELTDAP